MIKLWKDLVLMITCPRYTFIKNRIYLAEFSDWQVYVFCKSSYIFSYSRSKSGNGIHRKETSFVLYSWKYIILTLWNYRRRIFQTKWHKNSKCPLSTLNALCEIYFGIWLSTFNYVTGGIFLLNNQNPRDDHKEMKCL